MKNAAWIEQTARGHAAGIALCLGLTHNEFPLYKVTMDGGQIGAYQEKDDVLNVISANWDSFQTAAIEKG